ncbi:MAG: hypothetical protein HY940_00625 [Gammaproteobacteria bacterium]|nr:hypothetical protein [Gammaproteobacteria bacterium]
MTLLDDPLIQSSLVPMTVTLLLAVVLGRLWPRSAGLAVIAGFYVAAALIHGLTLTPLTSTRKILLLGLLAVVLALAREFLGRSSATQRNVVIGLIIAGLLWMLWPALSYRPLAEAVTLAVGLTFYIVWLLIALDALADQPMPAGIAVMMLGSAAGIASVLAATALLGQLISALAAAAGVFVVLTLLLPKLRAGPLLMLPAAVLLGLLSAAALVYAKLPASSLLFLATIPALIRIPLPANLTAAVRAAMLVLLLLPAAGMAIYSAWHSAGDLPY